MIPVDALVDDFAYRSFRDQADADYISARFACRAALVTPFLWESQQTIEKYLKCILLLNRIRATKVMHDLSAALSLINSTGKASLNLTPATRSFIDYIDTYGRFRYLEVSHFASSRSIVALDRAVWELRRFCSHPDFYGRRLELQEGAIAPKYRIPGGYLENIVDKEKSDSVRQALLWQNAFFGKRPRRVLKMASWWRATNAPLDLHPEILDKVLNYVHLPNDVIAALRSHAAQQRIGKRGRGSLGTRRPGQS